MASNRLRALRNVGTRLNFTSQRLDGIRRRPQPTKLAQNLINTGNLRRYSVTEPIVAPNAITNEAFDDAAVDTPEFGNSSVTEPKLDIDAMTGKNITSCSITDSDIENSRFSTFEGSSLTVEGTFDLTNGTISGVDVTGPSTLTGADVVLAEVTLDNVTTTDGISATSGSLQLNASGDVILQGGVVGTLSGGGAPMNISGGFLGISSGGGFASTPGKIEIGVNWASLLVGGDVLTAFFQAETDLQFLYSELDKVQAKIAAVPECPCP